MSLPTNRQDDNSCGDKFRAMLKCVEQSGDISACTVIINRFLACERAVFNSALRSNARQSSTPPTYTHHELSTSPPNHSQPPSPNSDTNSEVASPTHLDRLSTLPALVHRAFNKQLHACSALFETLGRPNYPHRVFDFTQRIVNDAYLTCSLVTSKIARTISQAVKKDPDQSAGPSH